MDYFCCEFKEQMVYLLDELIKYDTKRNLGDYSRSLGTHPEAMLGDRVHKGLRNLPQVGCIFSADYPLIVLEGGV